MPELFKNKYRIPSTRLQTWNYADEGMYFITICTADRECYFGKIADEQMYLSELGKIAEYEWMKTPSLSPDMNLELGEFVVMPNHVHGIIMIGANQYNGAHRRDAMHGVSATIWQSRFHDHIIRSMDDYHRISNYIMNNPAKWQDDEFYTQ